MWQRSISMQCIQRFVDCFYSSTSRIGRQWKLIADLGYHGICTITSLKEPSHLKRCHAHNWARHKSFSGRPKQFKCLSTPFVIAMISFYLHFLLYWTWWNIYRLCAIVHHICSVQRFTSKYTTWTIHVIYDFSRTFLPDDLTQWWCNTFIYKGSVSWVV